MLYQMIKLMTFLMTLISEHKTNSGEVRFYNGIDFDFINDFPNDGSSGISIFLIDNWVSEFKKHERSKKIESVLESENYNNIEDINNNCVMIYQTNGETEKIYNILLEKFNI